MHLPHLLTLTTLLSITSAVPILQDVHATPTSSTRPFNPSSHLASPTPVGAYQCPPRQYKSCCQSVQQTSKGIMKGLGDLVPILGGIQISSEISFKCKNMAPNQAPSTCNGHGYAPMCCSDAGNGGINTCQPFRDVKEQYYQSFGYGGESQVDIINDAVA